MLYILPPYMQEWLGNILNQAAGRVNRERERFDIYKEECTDRFGTTEAFDLMYASVMTRYNSIDLQYITDFLAYCKELREAGYMFAGHLRDCVLRTLSMKIITIRTCNTVSNVQRCFAMFGQPYH